MSNYIWLTKIRFLQLHWSNFQNLNPFWIGTILEVISCNCIRMMPGKSWTIPVQDMLLGINEMVQMSILDSIMIPWQPSAAWIKIGINHHWQTFRFLLVRSDFWKLVSNLSWTCFYFTGMFLNMANVPPRFYNQQLQQQRDNYHGHSKKNYYRGGGGMSRLLGIANTLVEGVKATDDDARIIADVQQLL